MKALYPKTLNLNAAVADPRIMGVIREEGGKMYMAEGRWNEAYNEFYEGFRGYQEAGNPRAKDALKYVVLANMLALSDINPFAAREAIAFQEEKEIVAMRSLRTAYEANDLTTFESTLKDKSNRILEDPFIMTYVAPLRRRMREQVLLALVRPYHRIQLSFIARELELSDEEVERLVVDMILEGRVQGKIDQIKGFLLLGDRSNVLAVKKFDAMASWAKSLEALHAGLSSITA
uniref:PCI domain-containing protein n=2 Tax=Rhizochromulina marina TaxID=1034831 RepID=A0A7S2W4B1_9STRA|mmetsp:Transcript_14080/g.41368  ORF Transcript_14080/g.41368 Transcript_14080/m.41368 type:complete len:233 (+) Transcript_14080:288-986(+)